MSRNHPVYMSNSNMSDIKESIEEYSMQFQNSNEAISEMISVSRTGPNVSMPKAAKIPAKKSFVKIVDKEQERSHLHQSRNSIIEEVEDKENASIIMENPSPNNELVNLGDHVYKYITERFLQVQGTQTKDPDVLFQFYKRQRKNHNPRKSIASKVTVNDMGVLMPSSQRKFLLKIQFQKILTYYPQDVYYTLVCSAQKALKDEQLDSKVRQLGLQLGKRPESQRKNVKQMVDRLYAPKRTASVIQGQLSKTKIQQLSQIEKNMQQKFEQRQKRTKFGTILTQLYRTYSRNIKQKKPQSADNLHKFWSEFIERTQKDIEWDEYTVQDDIKLYMAERVEELLIFLEKKLGFKQLKQPDLKKFYIKYNPYGINIPIESFKQYVYEYNEVMKHKQQQHVEQYNKKVQQSNQKKKQRQIKKFGRPVSATPISVLSKPKTSTSNYGGLIDKYQKDKFLNTILHEDKMKVARRAFEYGIYDLEQQVKTKGRVKPIASEKYDDTVFKLLNKTFTNKNFYNGNKQSDRLTQLFDEEGLYKEQNWRILKHFLQEAMLVKSYEEPWFRDAIIKYCSRITKNELKYSDDKTIMQELMQYLQRHSEGQRQRQLLNLRNVIDVSEAIAKKNKQIEKLGIKGPNANVQQKRLFYNFLQQRAGQYVRMRIEHKQINVRSFLNEMFQRSLKDHNQFVTRHFHPVSGDKQCPKLLKYEFFRIQKQINPFTQQRDAVTKCHAWIPPKGEPQSFNYKTFNTYSNTYTKNRNKIVGGEQDEKHKKSIWGYGNKKQRQILLMSYDDAKECVFHPKISRPDH